MAILYMTIFKKATISGPKKCHAKAILAPKKCQILLVPAPEKCYSVYSYQLYAIPRRGVTYKLHEFVPPPPDILP